MYITGGFLGPAIEWCQT